MYKNKKQLIRFVSIFLLAGAIGLPLPLFAQNTETITISTYYPSPGGTYRTMTLFPNNDFVHTAACANQGQMYYETASNSMYVCDGAAWQAIAGGSSWTLNGTNLYPNNPAWNVGIGTSNPTYKLSVAGTILSTKTLAPAHGSETSAVRTDAQLLFYDFGANNWAGFGTDTWGDVWLRTGTAASALTIIDQSGAMSINSPTGTAAAGYMLDVNGKIKANNIHTVKLTVAGCGQASCWPPSPAPTYYYTFVNTLVTSPFALCTSTLSDSGDNHFGCSTCDLVSCQIVGLSTSGSNTTVSFMLTSEPNSFGSTYVTGNIDVYLMLSGQ